MVAPDDPVHPQASRQVSESGDERDADEGQAEYAHQDEDQGVGVGRFEERSIWYQKLNSQSQT
jgi:hypothetical protein